jgi:hypothetical protein
MYERSGWLRAGGDPGLCAHAGWAAAQHHLVLSTNLTGASECLLSVASDAAFDVHYVGAEGRAPETASGSDGRGSADGAT